MNFLNYNRKVLEEILAGSNSYADKTTSRGLHNFKMSLPHTQVLRKPLALPLKLCHI